MDLHPPPHTQNYQPQAAHLEKKAQKWVPVTPTYVHKLRNLDTTLKL